MACEKHKLRKRKDCQDCFPLGNILSAIEPFIESIINTDTLKPVDIQVASIGTLKDIEESVLTAEKLLEEPFTEINLEEYREFKGQELKKEVDALVQKKLKDVEREINKMLSIKHECLDIPLNKFNIKVLDVLLNDGWKLITFLTKDLAKLSGLKEDSVLLQRIRSDVWKKDVESYKLRFKE